MLTDCPIFLALTVHEYHNNGASIMGQFDIISMNGARVTVVSERIYLKDPLGFVTLWTRNIK